MPAFWFTKGPPREGHDAPPDVTLHLVGEVPRWLSPEDREIVYAIEARILVDLLRETLPPDTLARVCQEIQRMVYDER